MPSITVIFNPSTGSTAIKLGHHSSLNKSYNLGKSFTTFKPRPILESYKSNQCIMIG